MLAVTFYDAVVALHVMAIVVAFGVTFAYPVLVPYVLRNHPEATPGLFAAMEQVGRKIIAPAGTAALLLGAYLATDRDVWAEVWVTVPLVILIVLMGLGGAFFSPNERKLSAATRRDLDAGQQWSADTEALLKKQMTGGTVAALLVLLAIYFMVAKPFA